MISCTLYTSYSYSVSDSCTYVAMYSFLATLSLFNLTCYCHTSSYTHTHAHMHACTHARTHTHAHTHARAHTHTRGK